MPTATARRLLAAARDKPGRVAVVDRDPDLWAKFIDDTELIEGMLATGRVLVVTVADNPQPVMIASQPKVESELGPIAELPRWTSAGLQEPERKPDPPQQQPPESEPDDAGTPPGNEDWVPVRPQPKQYKRGDYVALDVGQFWLSAELEGEDDPAGYLTGLLGEEVTPSDLAEAIERLIDDELGSEGEEWVRADGRRVLVLKDIVDDVSELFIGADKEKLMQRLLKETRAAVESWGGGAVWGGPSRPQQGAQPAERPAPPAERATGERGVRDTAETRRPPATGTLPREIVEKMRDAHREVEWLIGRRRSIESETGYALKPTMLEAAYSEIERALGKHNEKLEGEPGDEAYDPAGGELVPRLRRLLGLLRGILRQQGAIDEAGVNHYRLEHLRRDVVDFLHHEKAASCDVLQRRPTVDMPSGDIDNLRSGGACGACVGRGAEGAAARLLSKVALQLSKGNVRATKDGQITIDPGLMNCPVVRAVIRELDTKASDMKALRERLDDMGMLVTQGSHGQVQVYCLSRTEGEGGAQTRMCQWFIDAHGNDGKFKIECAKD